MLNQVLKPLLERFPENNRIERIWKLAQVDFKKRYYDNSLGLIWALVNPIFRVAVYYFVFTTIFNHRTENFALYLFSGLLFWLFFAEGTNKGLMILQTKKYLIENIQFNKLDLFYSGTLGVFMGFLFNLSAYFLISLAVGIPLYGTIIYFPLIVVNAFILVLAVSILLATLKIYINDIVHVWAMVILLGFWLTPIFYSADNLVGQLRAIMYINPMAGIVVNSRETILYGNNPDFILYIWDLIYAVVLLDLSIMAFKKFSHKAAERM